MVADSLSQCGGGQSLTKWWRTVSHNVVADSLSLSGGGQSLTKWWRTVSHNVVADSLSQSGGGQSLTTWEWTVSHNAMADSLSQAQRGGGQSRTGWWRTDSHSMVVESRVDSFVFFLVSQSTKLNETGHCFAELRKNTKIRIKCFELFAKLKKSFCFVVTHISNKILYLLFEFRTFYSSFVPFILVSFVLFEFRSFYSSCVPFSSLKPS